MRKARCRRCCGWCPTRHIIRRATSASTPKAWPCAYAPQRYTWASVGLFKAAMFEGIAPGTRMALRPLLERAIDQQRLGARLWTGGWIDVGTAERLQQAQEWVARQPINPA